MKRCFGWEPSVFACTSPSSLYQQFSIDTEKTCQRFCSDDTKNAQPGRRSGETRSPPTTLVQEQADRKSAKRGSQMNFDDAWILLMNVEPKHFQTATGKDFVFEMETDSISYRPRNGKGNKKTQSKERFKDFFNKYFVGGKISRNDYRNRKGAGSLAGGYSYFMPLFQLIKNHSAKDNVPLNLNDSEVCKNQDIIAVIVKIDFGDKSEVYPDKYIDEMKRGEWTKWNTPRKYKYLEGKGKKLILYDRELKALTVEVEIQEVNNTNDEL